MENSKVSSGGLLSVLRRCFLGDNLLFIVLKVNSVIGGMFVAFFVRGFYFSAICGLLFIFNFLFCVISIEGRLQHQRQVADKLRLRVSELSGVSVDSAVTD